MNLLENLHTVVTNKVIASSHVKLREQGIGSTLLNVAGDAGGAVFGALGPIGMVPLLGMIADNVSDIKSLTPQLEDEMSTFKSNPTPEGMQKLQDHMYDISVDLLDLSSRLVQLLPDPTAISDIAAFFTEQIIQLGFTAELPLILDKLHGLIGMVPFVGSTDVVKAMEVVGEAHELISEVAKGMEKMEDIT